MALLRMTLFVVRASCKLHAALRREAVFIQSRSVMLFDNPEARSLLANRQRRTPCMLLLDRSYSMAGEKIRRLNAGFDVFRQDILHNPVAAQSVDLAVISFGPVKLERDFTSLRENESLQLKASGATPMRQALELAMLKVSERKLSYQQHGISYYRPWIFLLTDGEPTDDDGHGCEGYKALIPPLELAAKEQKFTLFTVGVNVSPRGRAVLDELSRPFKGRCLDLDNLKFEEMFLWLSASLSRVSQSAPGDRVQLVDPRVGDDMYDGWVL